MLSPMRLERFELRELAIRTKQPGPAREDKVEFSLLTRHGRIAGENKFRLEAKLIVKFLENSPTKFSEVEVLFAGTFSFPPDMPDESIRCLYPVVAMANLLGMVRGLLVQTTGMFDGGPFYLPLLNLTEFKLLDEEGERRLFSRVQSDESKTLVAHNKPAKKRVVGRTPPKKS